MPHFELQNSFRLYFSLFMCLTKKTLRQIRAFFGVARFGPKSVLFLAISDECDPKHQKCYELPNVAHKMVLNTLRLDLPRFTLL